MTRPSRHLTVSDVMTSRVHVASPQTLFKSLVRLIDENRVSAIPIVDQQGIPIGIVSATDLLLKEKNAEAAAVASEVMTSPAITVEMDARLSRAGRLMQDRNVRRLVVVDARGRIAGIVSRSDLLKVFLRTDAELREVIVGELIPAVLASTKHTVGVVVRGNIATLTGEVDRKSDVEMLARMTREIDGLVGVVDELSYRWDDTDAKPIPRVAV